MPRSNVTYAAHTQSSTNVLSSGAYESMWRQEQKDENVNQMAVREWRKEQRDRESERDKKRVVDFERILK